MKTIKVQIKNAITFEVDDDFNYNEPSEIQNAVAEHLARNNTTPEIMFFDSFDIVEVK